MIFSVTKYSSSSRHHLSSRNHSGSLSLTRTFLPKTSSAIAPLPCLLLYCLLFLSATLPTSVYAVSQTPYDIAFDKWRVEGYVPSELECGITPIPTTRMREGDSVLLDASHVCDYRGILLEPSSDPEHPTNIAWLQTAHWFGFDVALSTAGLYDMEIRTSSVTGEGAFVLWNAETGEVYKHFSGVANTGGWQNWETMQAGIVALPRGSTTLRIESIQSGWNLLWVRLTLKEAWDGIDDVEFDETVEAEDFDLEASIHDAQVTLINFGDDTVPFLDNIYDGDEIYFDLQVEDSGKYTMYTQISNPAGIGSFVVYDSDTGHMYARSSDPLPATASFEDWTTDFLSDIYMEGGKTYRMALFVVAGGWNLATLGVDLELVTVEVVEPFISLVPARDFLPGSSGVDIDDVNQNVGNIVNGATLEYVLENIPTTGLYTLRLWIASPLGWGSLAVHHSETDELLAELPTIPPTGDSWLGWVAMPLSGIQGTAGEPIPIRIDISQGGFNMMVLSYFNEENAKLLGS